MRDIEVNEKETAQFECEPNKLESNSGQMYPVAWYRRLEGNKEEKIEKGGRFEMVLKNKKLILKINEATLEDAGTYIVTIGEARTQAKLTVKEIPVVFKMPLEDRRGKESHSVTFECIVNRGDKPVKWFANGELINTKSGKYVATQDKTRLQLIINDLDLINDDDCSIACQVGEKLKSKAKLRVDEDDIRFVERLVDVGVKETTTVCFTCKLNKTKYRNRPNQELKVKWYLKGKEIKSDQPRFVSEQNGTVLKLNISSVSYEDAGEIKCEVNGEIETSARLSVEEEPVVFVRKLSDITCTEIPGKICLECELNKPFSNVAWYKNGVEMLNNNKIKMHQDGTRHYLTISDVDGKDDGEYTIVLLGKYEKKCSANLNVRAAPRIFLDNDFKDNIVIKRGQTLEMEVNYRGYPEPKLNWSFDDEPLRPDNRTRIENFKNIRATVTMTKTTRNDSGKYILILENECGRDKCAINVKVLDKPSPPRNPNVFEIQATTMKLSWNEPSDDGGSPITGYVIEMKDTERGIWTELATPDSGDLKFNVKNLKLGKFYSFRISAKNKYGTSDPVETKEFEAKYPFRVPDPPINVQATEVRSTKSLITFDPPHFDGGSPIIGYIVERRETSSHRWLRLNKEPIQQLYFKCEDLFEDSEYEVRIIAENLAGPSEPSLPCKPFKAKNPYERPDPPINLRPGAISKTSIELLWNPPLSDGGSPITGYKIEKRNPKTFKWMPLEDADNLPNKCSYTVNNLKEGTDYDFRVIAVNAAGDSDPSQPTGPITAKEIVIGDKPTLIGPMKDVKVMVGETAKFVAQIRAKPYPEIKWAANERVLGVKDDFISSYDNETVELLLHNVQLKDQGIYKVTVKNALGELSTDAKLTVLKKPEIKYNSRYDKVIEVLAQQTLNINCEVTGYPKPVVKWFKGRSEIINGKPEISRANVEYGEQVARLDMPKILRNEGGEYSITAENEVGTAEASFKVRILDVPMPPENLKAADVTSTTCKLTWSPPEDDGNSPIIGYYIEKLDPKRGTFIRLDKTSLNEHLIEKLQKGQTYQFRVIAENRIGLSDPCELKEPVLAKGKFDVPGAPESPVASEITNTSCRISWQEPRSDGGAPIKGYFVERKCATKWLRVNKNPEERKYLDLRDLIQGMDYEFRVCAVNEEGEGPFSKPSDSITAKNKYDKPDAPIDVNVNNITKSSCLVTWRPPLRTGGQPIIRYHIEMRTKGEYKFFRFTDDFISECEYEVKDLIENQEYEFRIIAENKQGQSLPSEPCRTFKAKDNIPGVPPEVTLGPEFGNLIGTQGKIQATVTGQPICDVRWKKGSKTLNLTSSKYSISFAQSLAVLYINNLVEEDAGQYTCEAENSEGTDSKSCKFSVYAPPAIEYDNKYKKTSVVSVGSNFRIACQVTGCPKPSVVWSKDDSVLNKSEKAKFDNPTDTQHYLTIKQCDRHDSGSYVIKATNPSGKDEAKFDLQVVDVPDKPRGPIDITLESSQARVATLEWRAPKWDGGSELIGYTIEYAKILEPTYSKSKI